MEDSGRRMAFEFLKELRSENKADEKSNNQEICLNWMYKSPCDLVDKEEYLLGKAIDKTFEILNNDGNSDVLGRTGEQSNVPKRLLEKTDSIEQVDIAKKILEDPLYAIKQKEMEVRKKLLNNPVKLKQIKQMLLERSKQNSSYKTKKKKLKKKSEQDLNLLIFKKLRMFSDKEKKKALNKIMRTDFDSSSTESNSSDKEKDKKHKLKRKRCKSSNDDSNLSNGNTSGSEGNEQIIESNSKKRKNEVTKKKQFRKSEEKSMSNSSSYDCEKNKKFSSKKLAKKTYFRQSSYDSGSENSSSSKKIGKSQDKSKKNLTNSNVRHKEKDLSKKNCKERNSERQGKDKQRRNIDKRDSSSDKGDISNKNFGLMMPDGFKPEKNKRAFPDHKYQKKIETKAKYVSLPKARSLSHKEREEKLKEMMESAKLRKEDREKNLANYRKKLALEEEYKTYDDDFIRRQMLHLTSQGTMADRIKSNINNLQRCKSSMDTNFVRK